MFLRFLMYGLRLIKNIVMCDFPVTVRNPNKTGKLGYPTLEVPCGKCAVCLQRRANQWAIRLHYQLKESTNAHFITLTYATAPRSDNGYLTAVKTDLQLYFKRLRSREARRTYTFNPAFGKLHAAYCGRVHLSSIGNGLKYYACSEYGDRNLRPHYHAIVFNVDDERNFLRAWPHGNIDIGTVTPESIAYVAGYIGKRKDIGSIEGDDRLKEFSLMSKNMGLYYVEKARDFHDTTLTPYTTLNGIRYALPRYYKEKIFPSTYVEVEHFAKNKPLIKHKIIHPKQLLISKSLYEKNMENEARFIRNFDSLTDWQKNCREVAQARNEKCRTIVQSQF